MAYVTSLGQVAEMANCSRPSPTDVIFVAMDALVERIYVEDLIAKRNVTAMSYSCVVHLNCRHSINPRPDRSRLSGLDQKNLEITSSWIMVRQKVEIKPLDS